MPDEHVYFFTRVMKTGSTSFDRYLRQALGRKRVYPQRRDKETPAAAFTLDLLREAHLARGGSLRGYTGHFPAFAADIVGATRTITFLRHPVERTISLLTQRAAVERGDAERSLEEIYDDENWFRSFVHNHQTKIFSLTESDRPRSYLHHLDIDRRRFDAARKRLAAIDVVGLQEEFRGAVDAVRERWGWPPPESDMWLMRAAVEVDVPDGLRLRIAEDNAWDVKLYEWAVENVAVRGAPNHPADGEQREQEMQWTERMLAAFAPRDAAPDRMRRAAAPRARGD